MATNQNFDAAFNAYHDACVEGKLGAALQAADILCQAPAGKVFDLLPLPGVYPNMQKYAAGLLQGTADRIEQYNATVERG